MLIREWSRIMAMTVYDGAGGRAAPAHGVLRRAVARMTVARPHPADRRSHARLLGLDDAGFATCACDRRALEQAGRGDFPL
jgi:hypothetical protein